MSEHLGYIRVSTANQNTDRQLDGVELDKVFEDKASGKNADREQLQLLIDYAREGDTVHVHSIDRLARSLDDLRKLVNGFINDGITVIFHSENLTFQKDDGNEMAELMLNMLGSFADFERKIIARRRMEGIEKAKARGVYKGRAKSSRRPEIIKMLEAGDNSVRGIAKELGVSPTTVQTVKKELLQQGTAIPRVNKRDSDSKA